ncbi:hypothetical protein ACXAT3_002730 [Clostridium sporogenes]
MINIYLYYYDNYEFIVKYLKQNDFDKEYSNSMYDKYVIKDSKEQPIIIIIYKNTNILTVIGHEEKFLSKLKGLSFMRKVNLLDKNLFINLFEKKFSENLCKISINIDILGSDEELVEFGGSRLLDLHLLDQFDFYDFNSQTKLKAYALQPKGYKYILKISSMNKLEFNKKYNVNEIEKIIYKIIIIIKLLEEDE